MTVFTYSRNSGNKKNGCVRVTKNSGNHVAQLKESYNIKATGATYLPHKKIIALSGYSKMLSPFIYLYTITTTAISFPAIRGFNCASVSSSGGYRYQRWPTLLSD
jgi:hypothetical protein